jgi:Mor transcription activator family
MTNRHVSAAELAVLEALLPAGLTPVMQEVAQYLYEPLVLADDRCGQSAPAPDWLAQLQALSRQVLMQLQHLADQLGGAPIYLAKGIAMHLSRRNLKMCAEFRGEYKALGRKYGMTEMRCRQIVDAWQRTEYLSRQSGLPGLD